MPFFKHHIIIILCLIIKASTYKILKKYGKVEDTGGSVIFESNEFSSGDNMFFKIKINKECKSDLEYEYYDASEGISSFTEYSVSQKSSETTRVQGSVTSKILYFTIEKKSTEYNGSNGNYLFLNIDCNGKIDFENTEKDKSNDSLIIVVVVTVVFLVIIIVIIGVYCCKRKKALMGQQMYMNQPYIMYGNPQMYPQQGNIPIVYRGKPEVIPQPNGIPYYNNSNIQYSNLPYNPANASMNQMNQPPNQNCNMIDQSSDDRGYNSNAINEKGGN